MYMCMFAVRCGDGERETADAVARPARAPSFLVLPSLRVSILFAIRLASRFTTIELGDKASQLNRLARTHCTCRVIVWVVGESLGESGECELECSELVQRPVGSE